MASSPRSRDGGGARIDPRQRPQAAPVGDGVPLARTPTHDCSRSDTCASAARRYRPARVSSRASRPPGRHPRLPVRPRRRPHADGDGALRRLEAHLRRVPAAAIDPGAARVQPARLQPLRRRQAPGRRRARLPRQPGDHAARGQPRRPARRGDRAGDRDPQERHGAARARRARRRGLPRLGALPARGEGRRPGHRRGHRVGQRREGHRRRRVRRPDRRAGRRRWSPRATGCAASPSRTPSWPAPGCSASSRRRPWSTRTRSPACRRAGRAASGTSSGWTASGRPTL